MASEPVAQLHASRPQDNRTAAEWSLTLLPRKRRPTIVYDIESLQLRYDNRALVAPTQAKANRSHELKGSAAR
ncbi:hypothetical protein BOSE62_110359 [Bosea sp. 62]|nr:hypothetical protein BOSE21B_50226 [Bosea sp. 21B]CAD5288107.1 hypothetical protein BOSE46_70220 [Bosea sp. 46]CAD5301494.1 hypothetical protein BOSE7B_90462 [Bosea sp. 7B]VVT51112.1 hypothetical protein BOS5A_110224 [Bosea sp. EC-HK365B]VXB09048.1 hypothetical protein BOSE62_110359 [Bosea sp. 62]VXB70797.1 hypothetical protein BOSE127_140406 [Bosea sp. 127]VXC57661.1 hypothetical protein BOSE29B_50220 [Bosea sp. 29B]VXC90983.1 hypothetical protein BOSE125_70285 [Bosea sp. 125]